jgi:hypothetical protein
MNRESKLAGRRNAIHNTARRSMIDQAAYARMQLRKIQELKRDGHPLPDSKRLYASLYAVKKMDDNIARYERRRNRWSSIPSHEARAQEFAQTVQAIRDLYSTKKRILKRSFGRRFFV